jgi:hypothetical protein
MTIVGEIEPLLGIGLQRLDWSDPVVGNNVADWSKMALCSRFG